MPVIVTWTGAEARTLRLALRLTVEAFAERLGAAVRTVAYWESRGTTITPQPDLQAALDTLLARADADTQARFRLLTASEGVAASSGRDTNARLSALADEPGAWWHEYADVIPDWFRTFVALEQRAEHKQTYESHFVPGLLQTEDYTRAVMTAALPDATDVEVERRVRLRRRRQEVLARPVPLRLWAAVDEAALRWPIGGVGVLRAQVRHLMEIARLPHVTLQVVRRRSGAYLVTGVPFTILRFTGSTQTEVAYLEQARSALYLDGPGNVAQYRLDAERLRAQAESPSATQRFLREFEREL